jgi:glycolate oxidase FAD binding subunit
VAVPTNSPAAQALLPVPLVGETQLASSTPSTPPPALSFMNSSSMVRTSALESLLDASRVTTDPSTLSSYAIHGMTPSAAAKPASAEEAAEIVRFAIAEKLSIIPSGNRTKLELGAPPAPYDIALDTSGLRDIAHYDPADLTLSVGAGMPIAHLNAMLFQHNQFLPLLTPCYNTSTIGGAIASGLDSPLRQFYGTARDFLLGAEFIDGTGALVKSGGRVVKNVTGYDLHKLLIGSLGTLGVITRLNFRTFPAVISGSRGLVASFSSHDSALELRRKIAASQLAPLTLEVLNPTAARIFSTHTPLAPELPVSAGEKQDALPAPLSLPGDWFHPQQWQLCAAFAGTPEVLDRYTGELTRFAEESHAEGAVFLDDSTRPSIWGRLREALPLFRQVSSAATIFRLGIPPSFHAQAITVLQSVAHAADLPLTIVARAAGVLYLAFLPDARDSVYRLGDADIEKLTWLADEVFAISRARNGDAALLFAPQALRAAPSVQAAQPAASSLVLRLKSAFDPNSVFPSPRL